MEREERIGGDGVGRHEGGSVRNVGSQTGAPPPRASSAGGHFLAATSRAMNQTGTTIMAP